MFFTNLQNNELSLYHKIIFAQDMSLSLTDILNSDLFKVVSHNGVYKIFPLFYCKNISCNNSDVKILENKCIITPSINDLFFNFTVDNTDIVIFEDVDLAYKDISDELSTSEFNNYIQLLRNNIEFKDNIHINNGLIEGTYADYMFQLQDVTVVDNGILITQETLDSTATVRLVNPVFTNSSYQLKIDVFSVSDVNILSESNNNNIVTDTLLIDLEEYADVSIPLTELDFNMIVGFDASVIIKQDKPIIRLNKQLELSAVSEGPYYVGDQLTLSALYKENNVAAGAGFEVSFYNKNNLLGSEDTDNNGIASYTYTPQSAGNFLFKCNKINDGVYSDILNINVVKKPTVLTLEVDENTVPPGETLLITGTLKYEGSALSNKIVSLVTSNGDTFNLTTDSNGVFSKSIVFDIISEVLLHAVFDGDATYESSNSDFVSVTIGKYPSEFSSVSGSGSIDYNSASIYGYLKLNGEAVSNTPVKIYNNNSLVGTVNTNNSGYFSKTIGNLGAGSYTLTAVYEGTEIYEECSISIIVSINRYGTIITPATSVFTRDGNYVYADGYLRMSSNQNRTIPNKTIEITRYKYVEGGSLINPISQNVITDSNGHFTLTIDCTDIVGDGQYFFMARFGGDDKYSGRSTNTSTKHENFIF